MITIIIPTLRVTKSDIMNQLNSISHQNIHCEVILSDGGNSDFLPIINEFNQQNLSNKISVQSIINPDPNTIFSRGKSINLAVEKASGEILLILHLDNFLPNNGLKQIETVMNDQNIIAGGFLKKYDRSFGFRLTQIMLNLRASIFKRLVGTNAMFFRKTFLIQNPFPEHFMEDLVYSDFLLSQGYKKNIVIIHDYITVSSAKYLKNGSVKQILINGLIMFLYRIVKVSYENLEPIYKEVKGKSNWELIKTGLHYVKIFFLNKANL